MHANSASMLTHVILVTVACRNKQCSNEAHSHENQHPFLREHFKLVEGKNVPCVVASYNLATWLALVMTV